MRTIFLIALLLVTVVACKNTTDPLYPSLTEEQVAEYRKQCEDLEGEPSNYYWMVNEHIGKVERVECEFKKKDAEEE